MNKQAMDQMTGYLKAAEQYTAALEWLTKRRSDWVTEPKSNPFAVDHLGWGTGTPGFQEADWRLREVMREYQTRILDDTITLCRNSLVEAEHQIKYWAERL